jgi:hypothetical protein
MDLLSQRKDFEGGVDPNKRITLLPEHLFVCKIYLENNLETCKRILQEIHDAPTGGHPRISNTWTLVNRRYEGPQLYQFVENYVKGCTKCQESKVITYMKCTPLYHFDTHVEQGLFQYISIDLITDLQWVKKLSQCLAVLERLTWHKSNKLCNNLKIIYVILGHLSFHISLNSRDLK